MSNSRPKHYAVVTSRRRQTFMCPVCGVLGGLDVVVIHTVRFQWTEGRSEIVLAEGPGRATGEDAPHVRQPASPRRAASLLTR